MRWHFSGHSSPYPAHVTTERPHTAQSHPKLPHGHFWDGFSQVSLNPNSTRQREAGGQPQQAPPGTHTPSKGPRHKPGPHTPHTPLLRHNLTLPFPFPPQHTWLSKRQTWALQEAFPTQPQARHIFPRRKVPPRFPQAPQGHQKALLSCLNLVKPQHLDTGDHHRPQNPTPRPPVQACGGVAAPTSSTQGSSRPHIPHPHSSGDLQTRISPAQAGRVWEQPGSPGHHSFPQTPPGTSCFVPTEQSWRISAPGSGAALIQHKSRRG